MTCVSRGTKAVTAVTASASCFSCPLLFPFPWAKSAAAIANVRRSFISELYIKRHLPGARHVLAGDRSEGCVRRSRVGAPQVGMVPCIQALGAELRLHLFRDAEILDGGEIPTGLAVGANIAESQGRGADVAAQGLL